MVFPPGAVASGFSMEWAKKFVSEMNDDQIKLLKEYYNASQEKQRKEKEAKEKEAADMEKQKEQQQSILDSLARQVPITVDVMRSSTSPDSQISDSCTSEEEGVTVKDVIIGKMKSEFRSSTNERNLAYRPRGIRERVFFENYHFVFDKYSYDAKKKFFRCERKNTCPARIHTPVDSQRVIHRVQAHNHPAPPELSHYIDVAKVRSGFIVPLNPNQIYTRQPIPILPPPSLLTPQSDLDSDRDLTTPEEKEQSPMDILTKMIDDGRKPISLSLPFNFNKMTASEQSDIEMALTRFLFKETELRKEFLSNKGELPTIFPDAKPDELALFVADYNDENSIFELVTVKERNEKSIRSAIENHLKNATNRPVMINISSKINVPLSQQMIDQWKTEEFVRIDSSKPNAWKIHHVTKVSE